MSTYGRLFAYLRPYRTRLILSMICSVGFSIFSGLSIYLTIPLLETLFGQGKPAAIGLPAPTSRLPEWFVEIKAELAEFFQRLLIGGSVEESLLKICFMVIAAFLLKNIFGYLQSILITYIEQAIARDVRNHVYRHIHQLPLAYFTNERTGNLISRIMNDVNLLNSGFTATFDTLIRQPLLLFVYLGICLSISWKLTLISFVVFPAVLLIITVIGFRVRKESGWIQERIADLTSVLHETISNVKVVKAFGMEGFENRKFERENLNYFRTLLRVNRIRGLSSPSTEFLSALAGAAIIWYGGLQVLEAQTMKASEFLGFLFAMFQLMPPIKELSSVNNRIQEASAAGSRVFAILDTQPNIRNAPNPRQLDEFAHSIEFRNVYFSYVQDDPVLQGIDLTIRKGEIIAIVGPSGGGKSTLVDLVPRFYDPTQGEILIDGIAVRTIDLKSLRDKIGIVTQETILFNDSVRNNIAYGLDDCPIEKVMEAAKAANAHTFIMEMPGGYESIIGERGVKLSGGERQRISLARAILKNPPILILDEATSALDTHSEILVQEAIVRLMEGRTSIVIAHRLSTVQHASTIVVLSHGRIAETGTHAELLRNANGVYKHLHDLQFRI